MRGVRLGCDGSGKTGLGECVGPDGHAVGVSPDEGVGVFLRCVARGRFGAYDEVVRPAVGLEEEAVEG